VASLPTSQNWTKTKVKQNSDTDKVKKHEKKKGKKKGRWKLERFHKRLERNENTRLPEENNTIPGSVINKQLCWVVIHSDGGME
jgi:hypothetical protein